MSVRRTADQVRTYELGPLRLYRDDLEEIARAVSDIGSLHIETNDYEADNVEDISDLGSIDRIKFVGVAAEGKHRVEVDFSPTVSHIVLTEPNTLTFGIRARVEEICSARRKRTTVRTVLYFLPVFLLFGGARISDMFNPPGSGHRELFWWLFFGPAIAWFVTSLFLIARFSQRGTIVNAYRRDSPTFWERTADEWVVNFVMSSISAIVGGLIGYWVNTIT